MNARRFVLYAVVGATGTGLQYAILIAGVQTGLMPPPLASCVGAALGAACNYLLNHRVTFRSKRRHAVAASRFSVVSAFAIALNWAVMSVLVSELRVQYLAAQCMTTIAVMLLTYSANASWSFRPTPGSP